MPAPGHDWRSLGVPTGASRRTIVTRVTELGGKGVRNLRNPLTATFAAVLAAGALLAGCGGDADDGGS